MNETVEKTGVYQFVSETIDGKERALSDYAGKVILIVNTASQCGFTPQYKGLEALYQQYKDQDFVILGYPCNQFGHQEPGENTQISEFCELNYGVSFPMFAKVNVNGEDADPLYKYLKQEAPGVLKSEGIKWNFTKFLVGKDGEVVKRYAPQKTPESIAEDIEQLLS